MKRSSCDSQINSLVNSYANRSDATGMNLNELKEFKEDRIHVITQVIGKDQENVT